MLPVVVLRAEVPLTGEDIVARAAEAAGGEAWLFASTNVMRGHATLCRNGNPDACVHAEDYVMWREYPTELEDAHAGSGRFRLDARTSGRVLFQSSFDGTHMWSHEGRLPPERARESQESNFGFSAIRFAGRPGFPVDRLVDDTMEGHPAWVVRVRDPADGSTLFWIDQETALILAAAWQTPMGWHQRSYSEYYRVDDPGFMQPGRVRLYYDGVKTADIRWTEASINVPIADEVFVLGLAGRE
ncbi:MAG: hypothetical protein JJT85_07050 [Chromatiales bacterium]|nr:hypothetical protein [Chromatiales bacterium]